MNDLVAQQAKKDGVGNVEVILAKPDDPLLPSSGVDLIFTSNTYHHIDNRVSYLTNLRKYLRPNGRIAIIEFDRRGWLDGLWQHYTPSEFIKREMEQAGYKLQNEFNFLDRQSFLIFAPNQPEAGAVGRAVQLRQTTVIGHCGSLAAGGFGGLLPDCGSPIKRKELKTSVSLWCSWVAAGS